jgi:hypothetical protein
MVSRPKPQFTALRNVGNHLRNAWQRKWEDLITTAVNASTHMMPAFLPFVPKSQLANPTSKLSSTEQYSVEHPPPFLAADLGSRAQHAATEWRAEEGRRQLRLPSPPLPAFPTYPSSKLLVSDSLRGSKLHISEDKNVDVSCNGYNR